MKIKNLMIREVKTCAPTDSLNVAARIMWDHDCGCVPVVDSDNRVIGIVTDRDICMAAFTQGLSLHLLRTQSAMAHPAVCCAPDDQVASAQELMRNARIRRLPVCDSDGRLVGIFTLNDIARAAHRERGPDWLTEIRDEEIVELLDAVSEGPAHSMAHVAYAPEPAELDYPPAPPIKRGHGFRT